MKRNKQIHVDDDACRSGHVGEMIVETKHVAGICYESEMLNQSTKNRMKLLSRNSEEEHLQIWQSEK